LNLQGWRLILGEAGITRSLLNAFPPEIRNQVRTAIAHLDYVTLDTLPLSEELHQRAKIMLDLRGDSQEVLEKVSSLHLEPDQHKAINNLKSLVELLEGKFPLILDLSLIQTIDYYTGIVFEVVSDTSNTNVQAQVLGRGGRYDQLLGLYHPQGESIPGIGFELSIDDLYQILSFNQQLPHNIPASHWLVVPETPGAEAAAFDYAEKLRNNTELLRVEIDLGGRDVSAIRQYASDRSITKIAWIKADGSHTIEAGS
jgi:ATP phosphoribosyltransferase regulatory subunit